jgi:hypothetical protein
MKLYKMHGTCINIIDAQQAKILTAIVAVPKGGCAIHMFGRSGCETVEGNNQSAGLLFFTACHTGTLVFARV